MKSEFRTKEDRGNRREGAEMGRRGDRVPNHWVVTKEGLAELATISVRTLERMLKNGDITRMKGLPPDIVRFYLPDVIKELRKKKQKFGRRADGKKLKAETLKAEIGTDTEGRHQR